MSISIQNWAPVCTAVLIVLITVYAGIQKIFGIVILKRGFTTIVSFAAWIEKSDLIPALCDITTESDIDKSMLQVGVQLQATINVVAPYL